MHILKNRGRAALATAMLLSSSAVLSQDDSSAQGDVSVTIYNNDVALVQDIRQIAINAGRSRIEFALKP